MNPDDVQEMYRIDKSQVMPIERHKQRTPEEIVYIRFKDDPDTRKKYAWRFAETLIRQGRAILAT